MLRFAIFVAVTVTATYAQNVMDYLRKDGNYTVLVDLIDHANLTSALSNGGPYSIFAPDDQAFNKIPPTLLQALKTIHSQTLIDLLLYHVHVGFLIDPVLQDGTKISTMAGKDILISRYANGVLLAAGARIIDLDKMGGNGIVHTVDSVLFPPEVTITGFLMRDHQDFSDLVAALVLTDLTHALDDKNATYTLFAPDNDAFLSIPGGLAAAAHDKDGLKKTLLSHVVNRALFFPGLTDGMVLQTLGGNNITIHKNNNGTFANNALLKRMDQLTYNGVIHTLDKVITFT